MGYNDRYHVGYRLYNIRKKDFMITNDATFVLSSALNSTDVYKPLSEQAINKIYNDLMNMKDVVETTGLMMYNLDIGPYATCNDMNQEVIRYVDEYSIKIAGLIGMTRQECDPCQVIMDISPNLRIMRVVRVL